MFKIVTSSLINSPLWTRTDSNYDLCDVTKTDLPFVPVTNGLLTEPNGPVWLIVTLRLLPELHGELFYKCQKLTYLSVPVTNRVCQTSNFEVEILFCCWTTVQKCMWFQVLTNHSCFGLCVSEVLRFIG